MRAELPGWMEQRRRAAAAAYEQAMARGAAEVRALERMDALGLERFETRALSRVDTQGGYAVPPLYLMEEWVGGPRAGRPFANVWHTLPLPPKCDTVVLPKMVTGLGGSPQPDLDAVTAKDPSDAVTVARVVTVAGQADASMQWAEMTAPPGADQIIFTDLLADLDNNEDAMLLVGSGSGWQTPGVWLAGAVAQANGVVVANSNNASTSGQTLFNGGTASSMNTTGAVYYTVPYMLALLNELRGLPATHVILPPWVWWLLTGTADSAGRPVPEPTVGAPLTPGIVGTAWSLPVILDKNSPVTMGGTVAPAIGAFGGAAGQVTPVTAGNGTWSNILAVRAPDLYLFEGEITTRVLREAIAGSGQWRFQAYRYIGATPNRYTAAATVSQSTTNTSGGVTAGGSIVTGTLTQYVANSPLQRSVTMGF
jgi:hypothetical protein